jgi:Spy/CpxP family protein refolding chaperone
MIGSVLKGKLLVFAVFLVGVVTGALLFNAYETRVSVVDADSVNDKKANREVGQFFNFLGLTDEQRKQWQSIMDESKPEYDKLFAEQRKLMEPLQPKRDELREQTRSKIRAILTEEQRKQYDDFNERQRELRQQRQPQPQARPNK